MNLKIKMHDDDEESEYFMVGNYVCRLYKRILMPIYKKIETLRLIEQVSEIDVALKDEK